MIRSVSQVSGTSGMNSDGRLSGSCALVADGRARCSAEHDATSGEQHDGDQRCGHRPW